MTTAELIRSFAKKTKWINEDKTLGEIWISRKQFIFLWNLRKKEVSNKFLIAQDMRIYVDGFEYRAGQPKAYGRYLKVKKMNTEIRR